jgi:hypothetical protein
LAPMVAVRLTSCFLGEKEGAGDFHKKDRL